MPKYSKRHYIDIAKVLNTYVMLNRNLDIQMELIDAMTYDFTTLFSRDNPNFNRDTFEKAVYGELYADTLVDESKLVYSE